MQATEDILFFGGMNTDDEGRFLPDGDYRSADYLRGGSLFSAAVGVLENLPGNILVNNASLAAGTNNVIGACEWIEGNSIIYFIHNSSASHSIWRYNIGTGAFTLIVQSNILNFQAPGYYVVNPFVIDGLLFWTDGYFVNYLHPGASGNIYNFNPPRAINIAKAESGAYTINYQVFEVIKWPPRFAPTVVYANNADPAVDLWGRLFQFRYKYIYDNNEESCWSPISDLPIPLNGYWMQGKNTLVVQDNEIDVTYNSGSQQVIKIVLAVRLGNTGQFVEWMDIDKVDQGLANNTNYTVSFTNNSFGAPVPLNIPNAHLVPQIAGAQELIVGRGGELAYGDIREGYDNFEINVALTYSARAIDVQQNFGYPFCEFQNFFGVGGAEYTYYTFQTTVYGFSPGDIISFQIQEQGGQFFTFFFTVTTETSINDIVQSVSTFFSTSGLIGLTVASINAGTQTAVIPTNLSYLSAGQVVIFTGSSNPNNNGPKTVVSDSYNSGLNETTIVFAPGSFDTNEAGLDGTIVTSSYNTTNDRVYVLNAKTAFVSNTANGVVYVIRPVNPKRTWKTGTTHKIALKYEDQANREGSVLYVDAGELTLPSYSQIDTSLFSNPRLPFLIDPVLYISNVPPEWATHYRVCVQYSTTIESFMWTSVFQFNYVPNNPTRVKLVLDPFYTATFSVGPVHQIQPGDKVRFIRKPSNFNGAQDNQPAYIGTGDDYVFTVLSYTPGSFVLPGGLNTADEIEVEYFDAALYDIITGNPQLRGAEIEIFRTSKNEEQLWFESPVAKVISNSNRSNREHAGDSISGNVVSMDFATQITRIEGYYAFDLINRIIGLTGTGNDGLYTINALIYDPVNDWTLLQFDQAFANTTTGGTFVIQLGQDIAGNLPAVVFLGPDYGFGDVYLRPRLRETGTGGRQVPWEEDPAYTDYWPSSWYGKGRIVIEDVKAEGRQLIADIVHSKNYLDNTSTNGLNVFEVQDRESLNEADGNIRAIHQVGDTLQIIQDRKNTSIYIQKTLALDPNGAVTYLSSDKTFAAKRPRTEIYGTVHKESAIRVGSSVFYYDFLNQVFVEASNNGQRSISDGKYKFSVGSKTLTQDITGKNGVYVVAYHDQQNSEVGWIFRWSVTVGPTTTQYAKTAVFNYVAERWKYYKHYVPSWACNLGAFLVEWSGGQLYKCNQALNGSANNYNRFFATTVNSQVIFVAKKPPSLIKRYRTLAIKSYGSSAPWQLTDVTLPSNLSYNPAQQSRILSTSFKVLEGYYKADYKRDMNSPNFANATQALIGGNWLRGTEAVHTLTLVQETAKTSLFSAHIEVTISETTQ